MQQKEPVQKAAVEKLKKKQQDLLDLKPIWDEKKKLENEEIPSLTKKKSELETKTNGLKESIDDLNGTVAILDNEHSMAVKCCKDASFLEQAKKEVKKHEASIASIESTRDAKAKGMKLSVFIYFYIVRCIFKFKMMKFRTASNNEFVGCENPASRFKRNRLSQTN